MSHRAGAAWCLSRRSAEPVCVRRLRVCPPARTARRLALPANARSAPTRWTPDGQAIAYVDTSGLNIWSVPLGGGPPRQITHFTDRTIAGFAWSHDGKRLAMPVRQPPTTSCSSRDCGSSELYDGCDRRACVHAAAHRHDERHERDEQASEGWCGREDLNLCALAAARPLPGDLIAHAGLHWSILQSGARLIRAVSEASGVRYRILCCAGKPRQPAPQAIYADYPLDSQRFSCHRPCEATASAG